MNENINGLKIVVIGDYATGKTTLTEKLVSGQTITNPHSTIGVAYRSICQMTKNGKNVKLQFWDTAGQERFKSIIKLYYRNADIIIICFDITQQSSVNKVIEWYNLVRNENTQNHLKIILVATKTDLPQTIDPTKINNLVNTYKVDIIYTSSYKNIGIKQLKDIILDEASIHSHPPQNYQCITRNHSNSGLGGKYFSCCF